MDIQSRIGILTICIVSPHISAVPLILTGTPNSVVSNINNLNCHINLMYVFQFLIIFMYGISHVFPTKFMNVFQFNHSNF